MTAVTEARLHPGHRPSPRDLVAGVSVAFILIPQALAYADLAGVPPYVGLFAAALPPIAAAFFASSRYLQTGPTAMTALLTFSALGTLGIEPATDTWVQLAALLALMVGVIRIALGLLRGAVIAYLLSRPVMVGFTSAAAILILTSQLPVALGVDVEATGIISGALEALGSPGAWRGEALLVSAVTVVVVAGGRKIHPLFPGVLIAMVGGLIVGALDVYGGEALGTVPTGLPPFSLDLPYGQLGALVLPALVVALVGFAEPTAIARTFAAADRERWSADRELVSQGVANLASGISGGIPVGGSFARTSVNRLAGGRTRWSGAVTGISIFLFLPLSGILEPLPRAVLAAIVIAAVTKLIRPQELWEIWTRSRPQGSVGAVTFVATLALAPHIEIGVILGIVTAVGVHLWRELRVRVTVDLRDGTLVLRPHGVLFFVSASSLEDRLLELFADHPDVDDLVLDLSSLGRIDYTGAVGLRDLAQDIEGAGGTVRFRDVPPQAIALLERVWEGPLPVVQG